ncbi:fibronectin type III domain-containing protein [Flavobacterium anhuiense]|uniref:fibronectin type III domain-containing protein n=1 Tax=Flavobacterium anhuiense TaxID=459526 RepID=UPI000E6CC86A|nr:fibronectin type III domain-containing protein [Flavobacterium anhuiense]
MKQVNFTHPGGFPLEQETLERLQTAYRSELYEAIKRHLSILPDKNYIIAHAQGGKQGWAIIHQDGEGILYPMTGSVTNYLKATKKITNLIYGDGTSQDAYTDYVAEYVDTMGAPTANDTEAINYYDLNTFEAVKSMQAIEQILKSINLKIDNNTADIFAIEGDINQAKSDINYIYDSYLPLNGSKAMQGDLNLGTHQLYLNNLNLGSSSDYLLAVNNQNQVVKNSTLLSSLIDRIETLEKRPATAVPIGMIALWGKPAPFPEGWEEYVPLRGRMPIGLDTNDSTFNTLLNYGGNKQKTLTINEIPPHTHSYDKAISGRGYQTRSDDNPLGSNVSETSGSTGGGLPFSLMNPYRVVHFIEYTGNLSDTQKPTSPTSLTASNIGTTTLTLNWNASTDNVGVTGYLVYKDNGNTLLAELGKDVLTYNVTGLSPNTNYNFQVKAKDATGNISDPASTNATTSPVPTPTVPELKYGYSSGENLILQWPNFIDEGPIVYELYRSISGGTPMLIKKSTDTFYDDTLSIGVTYSYQIRINYNGYISSYSNTVTITAIR